MPTYRVTLTLRSPLGTGLVSGTLWGHLAWAVRYLEGEAGLKVWLEEQEAQPWLLSSQMPVGRLPRPLLKPSMRTGLPSSLREMEHEKKARKVAFIPEDLFVSLRKAMSDKTLTAGLRANLPEDQETTDLMNMQLKAHNHIQRLTGTTPETGGLFFEEVAFPGNHCRCQIFVSTPANCLERLRALLDFIGENGFGSNASTGNGHFTCDIAEETRLFAGDGNRAMSLSHGVIGANMNEARYKQHVHFGKLGGDYAKGAYSPFKYPLLMARPGATFRPADDGPYGALLTGVHHHPDLSRIQHHALHLPLAFTEVES